MADTLISTPVEGSDPCGEDLRWDPDFMNVMSRFDALVAQEREGVVEGDLASSDAVDVDRFIVSVDRLCERTKDLRLLAVRAEVLWRGRGLAAFADALEELVAAAGRWPDPASGIHPRADPDDGDLGERVAPLARLLATARPLVAIVGWGRTPTLDERLAAGSALKGVFDAWSSRLEPAFGDDVPSRSDAWEAIGTLLPAAAPAAGEDESADPPSRPAELGTSAPPADAWDLMERAAELLATQDRHSPALPVLHLLLMWRPLGIIEIAGGMRQSGVTLEQLLDAVHSQLSGGEDEV